MRKVLLHISLLLTIVMALVSCDRTPSGVMSVNKMADLIADLQLADAYIDSHISEFNSDSSKQVIKQSVFKKHGITQQDYDSSLVWYAHNMEDYIKAHDKAIGKLKEQYDKLDRGGNGESKELTISEGGKAIHEAGMPQNVAKSRTKRLQKIGSAAGDTIDLWTGKRYYMLAQGAKRGFITFDVQPDADYKPGDRYQLAYFLTRGNNEFKVSMNVDYTDGATSQIARGTNSDGWVIIDVQSDTARHVRRIYGYVSYDIKRGQTAYVDSLMLLRSRMNKTNYGFINAQRLYERKK